MNRKKERTSQQIRARFIFAVGLLAFMLLFTFGSSLSRRIRQGRPAPGVSDTVAVLDRQMDSITLALFGPDAQTVEGTRVVPYEYLSEKAMLQRNIDRLRDMLDDYEKEKGKTGRLDARNYYAEQIARLSDSLVRSDNRSLIYRTVSVRTGPDNILHGFQRTDTRLRRSEFEPLFDVPDSMSVFFKKGRNEK